MIRRLMVANRGEIAIRIARTCREMGVDTVLAHSSDDVRSVAARAFDRTISLGEGDARATYLNVAAVIDAARRSGADAIHPGYGFLSERAELAQACADAGIVFVGPRASSIERMGSKAESRRLMSKLSVPVVPGYDGADQNDATLIAEAERIGFPLLVKASAGGGGKGMKIVRTDAEVQPAIESARREALKAFGDDRLLLEKYIEHPRHVEFQIFGDARGEIVHLFERDCSLQRRHQKVVEESPAPKYSDDLRARMAKSAIEAARGVDYENAGTVEFIVTPENDYYFLEMNTRLQVEHPVTELVTGVDLVRAQLLVASGEPLPWKQNELRQRGHAIEVRVYAEDAENGFLPQTGTIRLYREPSGAGIRVDSGVAEGSEISVKYDPMLAKLIAYGETRELAIRRLERALREYVILGTTTNLPYLRRAITHPEFVAGNVSTAFLAEAEAELRRSASHEANAIAALLASDPPRESSTTSRTSSSRVPTVWETLGTFGR
jgi:3-methylcrotonyl-CoA carboxylase alpha subunit